jgi:hypothetical protein
MKVMERGAEKEAVFDYTPVPRAGSMKDAGRFAFAVRGAACRSSTSPRRGRKYMWMVR